MLLRGACGLTTPIRARDCLHLASRLANVRSVCASSSSVSPSAASPSAADAQTIQCRTPHDIHRLGCALASELNSGDIVLLNGQVGAGKSELARGVIRSLLGSPDMVVPSPSFLLSQEYPLSRERDPELTVFHLDLYRLSACSEIEWDALDLDNITTNHISLIEWPGVALDLFGSKNISSYLELTVSECEPCAADVNSDSDCGRDEDPDSACEEEEEVRPRIVKLVGVGERWPESRVRTVTSLFQHEQPSAR
jgi:tRNA threonylcarbamoyl adenosine modification protein YjeE